MERELRFQTKKFIQRLQSAIAQKFFVAFLLMVSCGMMGQGTETFANIAATTGYGTRTWTGTNGISWSATDAREDQTINGKAITVRNGTLSFGLTSAQLAGGIGSLTLNSVAKVSPGDSGILQLVVNGTTISPNKTVTGSTTTAITWSGINVGIITSIVINQIGSGARISIDDIAWTSYTPSPCSGTPNGGTVAINPTTDGPSSTYTVSATAYASGTSGLSYQWQSNTDGAGWVNSGSATTTYSNRIAIAPSTAGSTVQWRLKVTCANSGLSSDSTTATFTVAAIWNVPITGNTSITTCTGVLYDSGGSSGNYASSSNGYTVINPSVVGNFIRISGSITSEAGYDYLTVYDGTGTGGAILWGGSAHGTGTSCANFTVPIITSTTGPLTIRFTSDGSSNCTGFALNISCFAPSATPLLAISGTTAHGSTCPGTATTSQTYTITNTGTSAANGITVVSSDPQFVVSGLSSTTISGSGGTATYSVTFTPSSAGAKTATITVASSTSGSNSPTSNLTGTGTTTVTPIAVTSAATAVTAYTATLNATNGTTFGACPNTVQKGFVYSETSVNSNPLNLGTGVITVPVTPIGVTLTSYSSNITGLTAGTSYSYKAYLFDGTTYTYGPVQTFTTLTPPANDLCGNAQLLVVNAAAVPGTFVSSSFETPLTSGKDVWYKINPSCNGKFTIDLIATAGQPQIYLYAACGTATPLQSTTGITATKQLITNSLSQGVDYFIRIMAGDTAAESATFTIAVNNQIAIVTQPANQTAAIGTTASFGVSAPTNQTGRQWQVSTDNGFTWTDIPGATASPYVTPATTISMNGYLYRAVISNGTCYTITSNAATLTVTACASVPTSNNGLGITSVTMAATTFAVADVTYLNYTGSVPTLNQGTSNTSSITFAAGVTYDTHIWIDFNDDGVFNNTTEKVYTGVSLSANPTTLNTSFTLSATAALGSHRMRIGTADSGQSTPNPCYSGTFGVTIDLMVNIVVPPPPTTYTWTGTTNTSWGTATNWSPNGVPGANDSVIISSPGTNGLIIIGTQTITNFTLNGTGNFTMTASGVLTINGNVTYGGTATASLNCASLVNITSTASQLIPPLTYGNLNALGGNRVFSPTGIIKICSAFSVNPALYSYTIAGSTVEYISPGGLSMIPFTYNNLIFSGTGSFRLSDGVINVNGNFLQSNGLFELGYFDDAKLNVVGNMQISGGEMNLEYADNAEITVGGDFTHSSGDLYLTAFVSNLLSVGGNYAMSSLALTEILNGNTTVNVAGNFSASGFAEFYLADGNTSTLNISGNMSLTGDSYFDMNYSLGSATVNLYGDLLVSANAYLKAVEPTTANTEFYFVGTGNGLTPATTQSVNIAGAAADRTSNIRFYVDFGAYVQLATNDLALGDKSRVIVQSGGTLDFGFNGTVPLNIQSPGTATHFTSQNGSTLKITSPDGISATTGAGNVRVPVSNRTYNQTANFHYIGKQNQVTGDGLTLGSTVKNVFVNLFDNTTELRLTNKVGISNGGKLEIQKGILIAEEAGADDKDFYGTGHLVMSDGEYRISTITANPTTDFLPQLTGYSNYNLTSGLITLNGSNANQMLSNMPVYKSLKIAGTNTLGSNNKRVSGPNVQITDLLYITESAILNTENRALTGTANVTMDGNSRWRNSRTTTTQPELTGAYNLTGGTMEFYGTSAATSQTIKGGISYFNLDINADAINSDYTPIDDFYNVSPASSITVAGNLNVNSPAAFKIASTHFISGAGNIFINQGATLLYGSENGIKTSGTSTADGAIRVSGTRTFSSLASYGFIGAGDMVTGNGLPTANVENLYIAKANGTLNVSLSGNVVVKNKMYFLSGNIVTGSNTFKLGSDATNRGTLEYTSGFVKGQMTRLFDGANSGDATSLFPLGTIDNKNRFAKIEFTSTTAPGTITASVQNTAMGTVGISTLAAIPAVGTCAAFSVFNTEEFYWNLTPVGIAGNYSAFFSKEQVGENPCEVTLLNRTATDWTAPGTHASATVALGIITTSRSGLNTFSDFGVGNKKCGLTKTWTGIWSGGTAPTITNRVVFAANYDSATQGGSVSACECEIQSGMTVTMAGGTTPHNMEIFNHLEGSGTLKLENNASLLQHSDAAVNIGKMEMTRNTQPAFRYDYTYWSSPVAAQSLHAVSPTTFFDKYYSWDASIPDWVLHQRPTPWVEAATPLPQNIMAPGKGYIIRAPQTFPVEAVGAVPQIFPAKFTGVPNNGLVSVPIVGGTDRFNLIGNPYPSAVSADEFLADASNTGVVEGTLYFWTHNTPITQSGGTGMYNYSAADYAVYNGVGATSTVGGPAGVNNNSNIPNGFIASGQSFFIKGSATGGTAVFHNSMREKGSNDRFFRYASAEDLPAPTIEKHRIWLNMTNDANGFSQSLIGYVADATNGYDRNFDGQVLGGGSVSLYSVLEGSKMTIQGRTLPFDQNDQVPMGFKATVAGSLKISIDHFDGLFAAQNIYLEDKALDIIHDLKAAPYIFTSAIGTFNERFILRYTNESLGTGEHAMDANDVIVAVKAKVIKVISAKENIQSITVFDLLGRTIYDNKAVNAMVFSTEEIMAQEQVLVVKIVLENNAKADRKIIFK